MDTHEHGYDFEWNDIYTGDAGDYQEPDAQLLAFVDGLKPGRALDVGCGAGGLVAALAERGWQVTGVDLAPKAIDAARAVLATRGLEAQLEVGDVACWMPLGRFDLITNSFALPNQRADQAKLFAMMRKSLAPGGAVLIKDFDATMQKRKEFARYHCPTLEELVAAFDGFEVLCSEIVETPAHDHGHDCGHATEPLSAALLYARKPLAA